MKLRKFISLLALTVLVGGSAMAIEGCFEESYTPAYGYGSYYPGPAPVYAAPPVYPAPPIAYGDWDEHHAWHDRDWWVEHRRPWVEEHHHDWLARTAPHPVYGHGVEHHHD